MRIKAIKKTSQHPAAIKDIRYDVLQQKDWTMSITEEKSITRTIAKKEKVKLNSWFISYYEKSEASILFFWCVANVQSVVCPIIR